MITSSTIHFTGWVAAIQAATAPDTRADVFLPDNSRDFATVDAPGITIAFPAADAASTER